MIKKITTCFLVMAIVTGCAQAPVVEQPQKPVEQEKPEEETKVKKIDESKDWVYVSERRIFPNLQIDTSLENHVEQLPFDEWINDFSMSYPIDTIQLNIDSKNVEGINQELLDYSNSKYSSKAIGVQPSVRMRFWVTDEILVLFIKNMVTGPGATTQHYLIYTIDLFSGKQLNNDDLLKSFDINDIQLTIDNGLKNEGKVACLNSTKNLVDGCYYEEKTVGVTLPSTYNADSKLFIDSDGNLCVIINCLKITDKEVGSSVTTRTIIKLN